MPGIRKTDPFDTVADYVPTPPPRSSTSRKANLYLMGGYRIYRYALRQFFSQHNIVITSDFENEDQLAEYLSSGQEVDCDLILLIVRKSLFSMFHRVRNALLEAGRSVPLLILAQESSREHVYGALRIGAKAYVSLDSEPKELVRAIRQVASGKAYLSPVVTELLVNDVSSAVDPSGKSRLPDVQLSRREVEIVQLLWEGLSSKQVARQLHISPKTVENHRYAIYRKCEIDNFVGLIRYALEHGMISL